MILKQYILFVCGDRDLDNQSSNIVSYPLDGANLLRGSKGIKLLDVDCGLINYITRAGKQVMKSINYLDYFQNGVTLTDEISGTQAN